MRFRFLAFVLLVSCLASAALAAPLPVVGLPAPQRDALIGDTVTFCVTFKNNGSTGFAPFIDLAFDEAGKDGVSGLPCDGITFVKAEMVGTTPSPIPLPPVVPPVSTPPCGGGSTTHPFAATSSNWPTANYPPGRQLVTLKLPFGSFDPFQPLVNIEVTARIHSFADDSHPLNVDVWGGFQFGGSAMNNVPPVISGPSTETITPKILTLTKRFLGAEDEVVPGPSFLEDYEIVVNVAPGQTINNLKLDDCASSDVQFTGITSGGTNSINSGSPNCFTVSYPSITGPPAGPADTIKAHFFITNALPLVPPACTASVINKIKVTSGTWQPQDPRDPLLNVSGSASVTVQKKALAIVKKATVLGGGLPIPPAIVQYTLTFRISDFASFRDLVIDDTLSDGLIPSTTATWTVNDATHSGSGSMTGTVVKPASAKYTCPPGASSPCAMSGGPVTVLLTGGSRIRFNLSQAISNVFPGGVVTGGAPGASGTIVFNAQIQQFFAFGPHSSIDDKDLDKHDPLLNHVVITGTTTPGTAKCGDMSDACLAVPADTLEKRIVAKNGSWLSPVPGAIATPLPRFSRSDTITYRLTKKIPSGNGEAVTVKDWFPQPVLTVAGFTPIAAVPLCTPNPPATNTVCYSATPNIIAPSMAPVPAQNLLSFNFGNVVQHPNTLLTIDIDITLTVTNDPFADGLFLTNEAQECEQNSYGTAFCQTAIAQFELTEPALRIHKGILCPTGRCPTIPPDPDVNDTHNPTLVAERIDPTKIPLPPKPICTTSAPCPRFTGTVSSSTLSGFIATKSAKADANDRVTFVVILENVGNGPFGVWDVSLKDVLPPELTYVPNTLCVTTGNGVPIATSGTFPASLSLANGTNGALGPFSAISGQNIAVLTFDAVVGPPSQVTIGSCLTNRAELLSYSNMHHGSNFVTAGFTPPFFAEATVCITPKRVEKRIVTSSEQHTSMTPAPPKLAIGEIVQYELLVQVPEGHGPLKFIDPLPNALQLIDTPVVSKVNATNMTHSFTFTPNVIFDFGVVTNNDNDPDCEYLRVVFNALVLNSSANNDGNIKPNQFTVDANGTNAGTSNTVDVKIVEPKLSIKKTVLLQGNTAVYTVTVTNTSSVTAFNALITDAIQPCLTNLTIASAVSAGGASTPAQAGTQVKVAVIPPGGSVTVIYRATILCKKCEQLNNTAKVTWTSLPGLGTNPNPTGSVTPGATGAPDGERDYSATDMASICGQVCGMKFFDANGNRVHDANESGLGGWTITATDANGVLVASAVTGADGKYCLSLLPGTYKICETPQPKWQQTFPTPSCHTVTITAGAVIQPRDFGNKECWGRVCGTKRGGKPGAPDVPLAGWTIYATPQAGGSPISTVTDANGHYCLILPGPGAYTITEVQQTGWSMTVPASGSYSVFVECVHSPTDDTPGWAVVQGNQGNALALDFRNTNLCATKFCPAPSQCIVQDGAVVCITPPQVSPCAAIHCGFGMKCAVINGQATCVP